MREKRFPILLRTTVTAEGEHMEPSVLCPREGRSIDARTCAGCMRMRSLEWDPARGGEVACWLSGDAVADPRADFSEMAARAKVQEIMSPLATCVTLDVPIARLHELFVPERIRAVAVVDEDGKLQGLISRTDIAKKPAAASVEELMTARVHALPDDAPISYAVSLMAFEDISEIPVVTGEGKVVGICHALDVMRWVATRLGYTAPKLA